MSLRTRLLVGLLGLCLAGLLAVSGGTYLALRSFLLDRVDQQLMAARRRVDAVVSAPARSTGLTVTTRVLREIAPPDTFIQLRTPGEQIVASAQVGPYDEPSPPPRLSAALRASPTASGVRALRCRGCERIGALPGTGELAAGRAGIPRGGRSAGRCQRHPQPARSHRADRRRQRAGAAGASGRSGCSARAFVRLSGSPRRRRASRTATWMSGSLRPTRAPRSGGSGSR